MEIEKYFVLKYDGFVKNANSANLKILAGNEIGIRGF